jgi:hypothetical protein
MKLHSLPIRQLLNLHRFQRQQVKLKLPRSVGSEDEVFPITGEGIGGQVKGDMVSVPFRQLRDRHACQWVGAPLKSETQHPFASLTVAD